MSQEQTRLIVMLFAAVVVFGIVVISLAVMIRRRRSGALRAAAGAAAVPVSNDPLQRFACALAAPYARREWHATRGARRQVGAEQTYWGYACVVPPQDLKAMLRRDWGVAGPDDARAAVADALSSLELSAGQDAGTPAGLAFDVSRFANLVRWSAALGLLDASSAAGASVRLAETAAPRFRDWEAFGADYVHGLQENWPRGAQPYRAAVDWLLSDPQSPWKREAWPSLA